MVKPLRQIGPVRLPATAPGLRIGLYGGSFDPPHAGHRHVALLAIRRLRLDRVWWLVGPGNPLKDRGRLPTAAARLAATAMLARHPRMHATGLEAAYDFRFSVETVRFLPRRRPGVRFVWIIGADSFATLHRWRDWRTIVGSMPVAVVDRPGWTLRALHSRAARTFAASRVDPRKAADLADHVPPAWTFLAGPRSHLSSSALRDKMLKALDLR